MSPSRKSFALRGAAEHIRTVGASPLPAKTKSMNVTRPLPAASATPTELAAHGISKLGLAEPPASFLLRQILALAAPTTVLAALQVASMLLETWLAARQGTTALAGWAVVLPFAMLIQQMSAGAMGGGVVSAIARAIGAGRQDEASALVLHALIIAVTAGALFAIPLGVFPLAVFSAIGGADAGSAAAPYAQWLFGIAAIPIWLTNTLASVLRGGGRHPLVAAVLVGNSCVYPGLAWLMMEPAGLGLPGLGVALATCQIVTAGAMGAMVWRGKAGFHPNLCVKLQRALFVRILSVGLVASALAAVSNLTTILVTRQIAAYGLAAVGAYGVTARIEFLMIPIMFGIGSALTALVGRAAGGGNWTTARRTAWLGAGLALSIAVPVGVFTFLFPHVIANALARDPEVAAIARRGLGYLGPALAGFGLGISLYFASMGAGRMNGPIAGALARITVAVGGGMVLANVAGMGLDGYFLSVALGITAYGALTAASVRPGVWRERSSA
jgi:Na+-driven multidrug efflux pump